MHCFVIRLEDTAATKCNNILSGNKPYKSKKIVQLFRDWLRPSHQ